MFVQAQEATKNCRKRKQERKTGRNEEGGVSHSNHFMHSALPSSLNSLAIKRCLVPVYEFVF